ncbi:NADH-ubiquinone/plastoquinone oxidoreductase subunit 6 [Salinisphaera sp. PC39]|uniref:NADH-quinone oxidoreductase subunit J n=1 Tax=Salinisphaera sp. PC39 TaxID=1304156 RepID=UPI00333E2833
MELTFYIAAAVATAATFLVVVSRNAVHALLYLIVSFLALATVFFVLGAPFAAALEVVVYAGAIVVLFVFVVMMLNVAEAESAYRRLLAPGAWIGPSLLALVLFVALVRAILAGGFADPSLGEIESRMVGAVLYGPYLLAVELAAMLLLAGFVGAYHLSRRENEEERG